MQDLQYLRPFWLNGNNLYISSSSMSDVQTCPRKAFYRYVYGAVPKPRSALTFGTMIHKAMEYIYSCPSIERQYLNAEDIVTKAVNETKYNEEDDTRTVKTATKIIANYLEKFKDDHLDVLVHNGKPALEVDFLMPICQVDDINVIYAGTIDMLVTDRRDGSIYVMDHKTGRSVGKEFIQRWNPNHQLTGYILAAQHLGYACNYAIINGLQVAKTVQNVVRVSAERTTEDFFEFQDNVKNVVSYWMNQYKNFTKTNDTNAFSFASGSTCSMYGACQYLDVCSSRHNVRQQLLDSIKNKEVETDEAI